MADSESPPGLGETKPPAVVSDGKIPASATDARSLVVRVLNGTRAGSEAALPASGRASIGYEYWHDVVVRDASAKGCAVEIETGDDGVARLTVLDGSALLLGSTLRSGDQAVLPAYVPVAIGDVAFAYGNPGSARWTDATSIVDSTRPNPSEEGEPVLAANSLADGWRASLRDSSGGRLGRALNPRAIIGIVLAILIVIAAGPAIDALHIGGTAAERTQRALIASGYSTVTVKDGPDDTILVGGYVPTDNDRQRVQSLIEAKALRATMSVETGDELARSTADVARMNGVEARTRALRSGVVELTTAPMDADGRKRIEGFIRRDVPGLKQLVFAEDQGMSAPDEVKTLQDATKRVASVVGGDPAYIVTVDGARYFPGAILPSGHRLVAIAEQTVVLERNGHQVKLKF